MVGMPLSFLLGPGLLLVSGRVSKLFRFRSLFHKVLGSGCYRIGASVEFDWSSVSAVRMLGGLWRVVTPIHPGESLWLVGSLRWIWQWFCWGIPNQSWLKKSIFCELWIFWFLNVASSMNQKTFCGFFLSPRVGKVVRTFKISPKVETHRLVEGFMVKLQTGAGQPTSWLSLGLTTRAVLIIVFLQ